MSLKICFSAVSLKIVSLSIKLLEEEQNREAIKKYGSVDSGKSLPFAELPNALKQKRKEEEEN